MPFRHLRRRDCLPDSAATPERVFHARRQFLADVAGFAAGVLVSGPDRAARAHRIARDPRRGPDDQPTAESPGGRDEHFLEWAGAEDPDPEPWTVELAGLCRHRGRVDLDALVRRFPLQERLYRHRCVEAWAMAVPWLGFPLAALVRHADPRGHATHVRLVARQRGDRAPYYEGLRMAEALSDLTLLATGHHGHALSARHGAPLRLVVPWKYAYKSLKAVARIEFTDHQPRSFWSDAAPDEYGFLANVDPAVPHPRWSQQRERLLGTGELRDTVPWNGYGEWVAGLYS